MAKPALFPGRDQIEHFILNPCPSCLHQLSMLMTRFGGTSIATVICTPVMVLFFYTLSSVSRCPPGSGRILPSPWAPGQGGLCLCISPLLLCNSFITHFAAYNNTHLLCQSLWVKSLAQLSWTLCLRISQGCNPGAVQGCSPI